MPRKRRPILRAIGASIVTVALMMLVPTLSRAEVTLDQLTQPVTDTTNAVLDASKKKVSVPEPAVNILLLLGLGATGLVGYYVQRHTRAA